MAASLTNAQVWTQVSGSSYDAARPPYPPALLGHLLAVHCDTGGGLEVAVDLGCGPGTVSRPLGDSFGRVHGVDISSEMYRSAKPLPNVEYHTGSASDLSFLEPSSVDLVTAATSSHWFDHAAWWAEMARVVRPSGSVACFTFNPGFILAAAADTPGAFVPPALRELIDTTRLYSGVFRPFRTPGNGHTFQVYDNLPGPPAKDGWDQPLRWRWGWPGKEAYGAIGDWDWDVQPATEGAAGIDSDMESEISLADLARYFASVSPVLKYRATLAPGEPDWVLEKLAAVSAEGAAQGEAWGPDRKVKVRRVLGLVIWKRAAA